MSAHDLGPDLDGWPEDPYQLLGVSFGVLPRDLRRAYTRLIRTYKPEQFPEHFQRIRDAYETVLQYAEFFGGGTDDSLAEAEGGVEPGEAQPEVADADFPREMRSEPGVPESPRRPADDDG